jgi:hypothetical protein
MLSRRTLFAVLSVGLIGVGALVLNTRAEDQNAAARDAPIRDYLIRNRTRIEGKSGVEPPTGGPTFDSPFSEDLQSRFVELQRTLAANLTDDELKQRIAATEKEIAQTVSNAELRRIESELRSLKDKYPESDAAIAAQRAIEALQPPGA